ncbi:MAG: hypothetical protein K1X89_18140 [Myxococcaceae bacterium]|nr:hypothetical protein [Myxococcaceae bacterium]
MSTIGRLDPELRQHQLEQQRRAAEAKRTATAPSGSRPRTSVAPDAFERSGRPTFAAWSGQGPSFGGPTGEPQTPVLPWLPIGTEDLNSDVQVEHARAQPGYAAANAVRTALGAPPNPSAAIAELRRQLDAAKDKPELQVEIVGRCRSLLHGLAHPSVLSGSGALSAADAQDLMGLLADLPRSTSPGAELSQWLATSFANAPTAQRDALLQGAIARGAPDLAVAMCDQLSGPSKEAAIKTVQSATAALRADFDATAKKVEDQNKVLGELVQQWGPLMSQEQLQQAIAEYEKDFPCYADLEGKAKTLVRASNALLGSPTFADRTDGGAGDPKAMGDDLARALRLTDSGKAELAELIEAADQQGRPVALLESLSKVTGLMANGQDLVDELGSLAVTNAMTRISAAMEAGNSTEVSRQLEILTRAEKVTGLHAADLRHLSKAIEDMHRWPHGPPEHPKYTQAKANFTGALEELERNGSMGAQSKTRVAFHGLGSLLAVAGVAGSWAAFERETDGEKKAQALVQGLIDTGTFGQQGYEFAKAMGRASHSARALTPVTGVAAREAFSKSLGVAGAMVSLWQAKTAFASDHDPTAGGLYLAQAGGALMMLAGSAAWTGGGAAIVLAAAAAGFQYERVKNSNVHENAHTEAFLRGAGLPEGTLRHLRDASGDGVSVGTVLQDVAARTGIAPGELLTWISQFDGDRLGTLVNRLHGYEVGVTPASPDYSPSVLLERWLYENGYPPLPESKPPPITGEPIPGYHGPYSA